jgi:hypothetical protein
MSSGVNDTPKSKLKSLPREESQGEGPAHPALDLLDPLKPHTRDGVRHQSRRNGAPYAALAVRLMQLLREAA